MDLYHLDDTAWTTPYGGGDPEDIENKIKCLQRNVFRRKIKCLQPNRRIILAISEFHTHQKTILYLADCSYVPILMNNETSL